jgi:hypothetical protein
MNARLRNVFNAPESASNFWANFSPPMVLAKDFTESYALYPRSINETTPSSKVPIPFSNQEITGDIIFTNSKSLGKNWNRFVNNQPANVNRINLLIESKNPVLGRAFLRI